MEKDINSIKFNLTLEMAQKLIEFNKIKKKLNSLICNEENLSEIEKLNEQLNNIKLNFIKEFRVNNKDEILEYLKLKDND